MTAEMLPETLRQKSSSLLASAEPRTPLHPFNGLETRYDVAWPDSGPVWPNSIKEDRMEDTVETSLVHLATAIEQTTKALQSDGGQSLPTEPQRRLFKAAKGLIAAVEGPDTAIWKVIFAPQAHAALQTAYQLGVFEQFRNSSDVLNATQLANCVNAERMLILRIMRALASVDVVEETGEEEWTLSDRSRQLVDPTFRTFAMGLAGLMSPYMPKLPDYLKSISYESPKDHSHTLFNYALGTPQNMFAWLQTQPELLATFSATMAASTTLKTRGVLITLSRLFPYNNSSSSAEDAEDKVLLVDIGGGKGSLMEKFRMQRPDLRGRVILQDLAGVVNGRASAHGVEYMAHDFFTPQPVRGAHTYFFRHIFHDWPDSACIKILRQTTSVMTRASRLVIADMVVPDREASALNALLDIGMMTLAGMERTEKHWRQLLQSVGLRIASIRNSTREENESASIIEAVLSE